MSEREALVSDEYHQYQRKQIAEMADWREGFDMTGVSIGDADKKAGSPKIGDKIARNPKNHADKWLVAADYFADNFTALSAPQQEPVGDTGNPEADRVINRLTSDDPDFDDCIEAAAFIHKLVVEHRGPDGFATWKDAAIAERLKRTAPQSDGVVVPREPDVLTTHRREAEQLGMHRKGPYLHELNIALSHIDELRAHKAIMEAKRPEPVGEQHRFRHPQKTMPDWSEWQPDRPAWEIESVGYEVEYRNTYGPDLLDYADRMAAERDSFENELARLANGTACCEYGNYLQSEKQAAERQLAELQEENKKLRRDLDAEEAEHAEHVAQAKHELAELQAKHDALVKRLREPDEEMLDAGGEAHWRAGQHGDMRRAEVALRIFTAMSAVALDKGGE